MARPRVSLISVRGDHDVLGVASATQSNERIGSDLPAEVGGRDQVLGRLRDHVAHYVVR
jgi:hypothetical protein